FRFITRGPPASTLFPYTTLFRSCTGDVRDRRPPGPERSACRGHGRDHLAGIAHRAPQTGATRAVRGRDRTDRDLARACGAGRFRSEEHTSELQSRENLVCRLLLE